MIKLLLFLACVGVALSAESSIDLKLKSGDLVFVLSADSAFDKAIVDATKQVAKNYTHVGIIEVSNKGIFVIEAHPSKNVVITPWREFITENKVYDIMRLKEPRDFRAILNRAKSFIGQPYDWYFLPNNGRMYCSELVWEAYIDKNGKHIFSANPMNFYDEKGNLPTYFKDLFAKLKAQVPQGVLGTNPNDMSKSSALVVIK